MPGIGPLTATVLVASVNDARNFNNSRQFAAWLDVVPGQHSSGGTLTLLAMSNRGDAYFRMMRGFGLIGGFRVTSNPPWVLMLTCWATRVSASNRLPPVSYGDPASLPPAAPPGPGAGDCAIFADTEKSAEQLSRAPANWMTLNNRCNTAADCAVWAT